MSKRRAYNIEFKMEVIKYAEKHTKRGAGRKFQVDESMVRRWVQKKEELSKAHEKSATSKTKFRVDGGGRRCHLSTIEDSLMEKITREQQHHVSCKIIQLWAKELAEENGLGEFAASRGWLSNFLKRYNLTIRRRTTTRQSVPKDLLEKTQSFVDLNKKQRELYNLQPLMIANMEETSI